MMEDLFVINSAGNLFYSWHSEIKINQSDDLISGFLSAINSFASIERGEDIKALKLKETTIIFEKDDKFEISFIATTKNPEIIELIHLLIHELMQIFTAKFSDILSKEFDGEVSKFDLFKKDMDYIINAFGLDILLSSIKKIDEKGIFKSITYIEPKSGHIFYIHAKTYVNKEKLSFLIPLIMNSARLLCQDNLKEKVRWILLNTIKNENLLVELRDKLIIAKQYELPSNFENEFLALDFFKEKSKYVNKPLILAEKFDSIKWDPKIKQIFLVDLVGKVFYSKIIDSSYDCSRYTPETISFLTASKKASQEIYNRILFNASIGAEKLAITCINFNNFALSLIGSTHELSDFIVIENLCLDILKQLK
ncbi:MAG TPA: hypothetical protein VGB37_14185 [Candidatus Lokiarchaeia archaeon]